MAKVNISIPDSFLKEIDKYKEYKKVNRSQFIIDAARVYFDIIEDEKAKFKLLNFGEYLKVYKASYKDSYRRDKNNGKDMDKIIYLESLLNAF